MKWIEILEREEVWVYMLQPRLLICAHVYIGNSGHGKQKKKRTNWSQVLWTRVEALGIYDCAQWFVWCWAWRGQRWPKYTTTFATFGSRTIQNKRNFEHILICDLCISSFSPVVFWAHMNAPKPIYSKQTSAQTHILYRRVELLHLNESVECAWPARAKNKHRSVREISSCHRRRLVNTL